MTLMATKMSSKRRLHGLESASSATCYAGIYRSKKIINYAEQIERCRLHSMLILLVVMSLCVLTDVVAGGALITRPVTVKKDST
jgi:hypothetical protein